MMEVENERAVRTWFEAYTRRDLDTMMGLTTDDCVTIYPTLKRYDRQEWRQDLTVEMGAFPDAEIRVVSLVCQDDRVAAEFLWKATQKGPYRGNPPDNRTYQFPCVFFIDMAQGKLKSVRYYWNTRLWGLHDQG
jgi:steroid delta-isomerase-like uncharacterized protein